MNAFMKFLGKFFVNFEWLSPYYSFKFRGFLNMWILFFLFYSGFLLPKVSKQYSSLMVIMWSPNLIVVIFSNIFPFSLHSLLIILIFELSWLSIRIFSKLTSFLYWHWPFYRLKGKRSSRLLCEFLSWWVTSFSSITIVLTFMSFVYK